MSLISFVHVSPLEQKRDLFENFQDYVQKPQRNCTFMNSAPGKNSLDACVQMGASEPMTCSVQSRLLGLFLKRPVFRRNLFCTLCVHHLLTFHHLSLGVDGTGCLLRAVCEVAAHPRHEDGLIGDAINMLLTAVQPHESG